MKFCIYYIPFSFMKIIIFITYLFFFYEHNNIMFLNKIKYKGDNSVKKPKRGFPIKNFRSGLHTCTFAIHIVCRPSQGQRAGKGGIGVA